MVAHWRRQHRALVRKHIPDESGGGHGHSLRRHSWEERVGRHAVLRELLLLGGNGGHRGAGVAGVVRTEVGGRVRRRGEGGWDF